MHCPEGTFCNETGLAAPQDCPKGHFCLAGSSLPLPCPVVRIRYRLVFQSVIFSRLSLRWQGTLTRSLIVQGTYTDVVGAGSCKPCPAGMYCSVAALTEPEGHCRPGYYCIQGSSSSSPVSVGYLTLLQTFWCYQSFHKPYSFYFPCFRRGFHLEIFAHKGIIALLARDTQKRCHALLAPGMDSEEPRMPHGACLVPLGFSAICLAKMLL